VALSALTAQFRDLRHALPFLMQAWLFATPILYSLSAVKTGWLRALMSLNPMSGVIAGFRASLLGQPLPGPMLLVSALVIIALLGAGLLYFPRIEQTLADRV